MTAPADARVMLDGPIGPLSCLVRPAREGTPTLVLLHGIQGTSSSWQSVCARLPKACGYVLPDLRGRGLSAAPDDPGAYAIEAFAQDLAAVISSVDGPVALVGWSMGVLVSLAYVKAHGEGRLSHLVLASGTACPGSDARWFHGTTPADIAEEAKARAERLALTAYARPEAVAGAWMAARQADLRPVLGKVTLPTLVLHGSVDGECPLSHGEALAAGIPSARLSIRPGGGHNLMAEDPGRMAAELSDFIASVPAPATSMRARMG